MTNYTVFVDGSCRTNGNGGIGIVWLKNGDKVLEYSKKFTDVTNNIMELTAIKVALLSIKRPIDSLEIVSDSEYSIGIVSKSFWKPKKNIELVASLRKLLLEKQKLVKTPIKFTHTRGHQKDDSENTKWNSYVDTLAQKESSYV